MGGYSPVGIESINCRGTQQRKQEEEINGKEKPCDELRI